MADDRTILPLRAGQKVRVDATVTKVSPRGGRITLYLGLSDDMPLEVDAAIVHGVEQPEDAATVTEQMVDAYIVAADGEDYFLELKHNAPIYENIAKDIRKGLEAALRVPKQAGSILAKIKALSEQYRCTTSAGEDDHLRAELAGEILALLNGGGD